MKAGKFCAVNRFTVTLTTAILCLGQRLGLAQVKPVAQKGWETTAAAGVTLTRGNSRTFLANLSLDTRRKWERDEAALGVSGGYGETTVNGSDQKNTDYLKSFGQYNRLFNDRLYGGVRLDGEYDGIAGVDYRFRVSPRTTEKRSAPDHRDGLQVLMSRSGLTSAATRFYGERNLAKIAAEPTSPGSCTHSPLNCFHGLPFTVTDASGCSPGSRKRR